MDQKSNQLTIDKLMRPFKTSIKSEKSCSPSPPLLLLQTGVEESTPTKLESIDESSSCSSNSSTTDKPACFIQANDLNEMNSLLNLIKSNFPNINVHLCLNTLNENHMTKSESTANASSANRTKYLSPSLKHSERASSIDNSSLNSIERQESKDSGFWSIHSKLSFESTKSLSISDSHSPGLQTPQVQQQPKNNDDKSNTNENYLTSPGNKLPYWKKWKKGQAWRYNSSSSNVSTDCSTNCEEGTTRNTSLNYTSFESNQIDSEVCKTNLSMTHLGSHFSNSFESNQNTTSSLSVQHSHHHLWASTSKLDQLQDQKSLEYPNNTSIDDGGQKQAVKRRGKLMRDRTIDNTDEHQSLNLFNNLTITNQPNLTNNTVKLENTRFDSISSLISPLSISSKESAPSPTSNNYKPNPFLSSNGRISPPEKRLSLNNDNIKAIKSTPPSVSSSPAPPKYDAVVAAVLAAAAISKPNNSPLHETQYDFYKDLHKLNLKTNDEYNMNAPNKSPSPPLSKQYLSTNNKQVSRSNSSPSYSSSCSSIPNLPNNMPIQMNHHFNPNNSMFNPFNMNDSQTLFPNAKSLSTCSLPMTAAAVAHYMNSTVLPNNIKLSPSNDSLNFNRLNTRPPEIVITESKVDNDLAEYNNERSNLVKQENVFSPFAPLQQSKTLNDDNSWKTNQFLNINRNQQNNENKQAKPHVCPNCQKRFARSDMLIRHSRLHSGVRPYRCNRCGQEFSRSDHLNTHLRTHTGEKPYSCPHPKCTYAACRKDMITRHLKVHNKNRINGSLDGTNQTQDGVKINQFQMQINSTTGGENQKSLHFPSIKFDTASLKFLNQQQNFTNDQQQSNSIESKDIKNFEIFNQLKS